MESLDQIVQAIASDLGAVADAVLPIEATSGASNAKMANVIEHANEFATHVYFALMYQRQLVQLLNEEPNPMRLSQVKEKLMLHINRELSDIVQLMDKDFLTTLDSNHEFIAENGSLLFLLTPQDVLDVRMLTNRVHMQQKMLTVVKMYIESYLQQKLNTW